MTTARLAIGRLKSRRLTPPGELDERLAFVPGHPKFSEHQEREAPGRAQIIRFDLADGDFSAVHLLRQRFLGQLERAAARAEPRPKAGWIKFGHRNLYREARIGILNHKNAVREREQAIQEAIQFRADAEKLLPPDKALIFAVADRKSDTISR